MLAQVVLTPAESKKLIAMAICELDSVKTAARQGTIVLHPSSTTYFMVEILTGHKPPTDVWACGIIVPKGACIEMGVGKHMIDKNQPHGPAAFPYTWVIRQGKVSAGTPLSRILDEMTATDVYVKGVNALDPAGNVGVLVGNPVEAGTIGLVAESYREKGFNLIFAAGLEKLITVPIKDAAVVAKRREYAYAMGISVGLFPCPAGTVVTELKAFEILSGAEAIPISAGGLGGAEGAVTLVLRGDESQVGKAIQFAESAKGAKLPPVRTFNCDDCHITMCRFSPKGKHWVTP